MPAAPKGMSQRTSACAPAEEQHAAEKLRVWRQRAKQKGPTSSRPFKPPASQPWVLGEGLCLGSAAAVSGQPADLTFSLTLTHEMSFVSLHVLWFQ